MPAGGANIADLFARLLLDDSGFETSVVKSADKAGLKAGQTLGSRIGAGLKLLGPAAIGGLFLAAAGSLSQLDDQVKRFQADVGATDEEAKSAGQAITRLYGAHRAGFDQIAGTLAALRTDQGLTEKGAEDLADAYLSFANVAGGTGQQAVKGLDDILDAFNLDASKGVGIMDQLVVSHQKYGGSITGNVAALAQLAPALQGLNLGVDDGIALLNLFAASGIDAGTTVLGLNTAVKNLKPGQTFQDLVDEISAIEDPTLRAQKAIEIFGKAGAKFAQALKPGVDSLKDFAVAGDEAGTHITKASKTIDSSIPAQFQLALQGIQGTLMQLIGPAGSVAQVALALVSLGATFDALKLQAVAGWLAVLGPVALAAGAGAAFLLAITAGVDAIAGIGERSRDAAIAAGDLTGAQAALKAQVATTTDELVAQDIALAKVRAQQYEQANAAAIAAGATNAQADAIAKAAVAADKGAVSITQVATAIDAQTVATLSAIDADEGRDRSSRGAAEAIAEQDKATRDAIDSGDAFIDIVSSGTGALSALGLAASGSAESVGDLGDASDKASPKVDDLTTSIYEAYSAATKLLLVGSGVGFGGISAAQALAAGFGNVGDQVDLIPPKITKVKTATTDAARVAKVELADAFRSAKSAMDALYDAEHDKALRSIEDTRDKAKAEAQATYDKQRAALFAPVTAGEEALSAEQTRRRERDLRQARRDARKSLSEAVASGDPASIADARRRVRDANEALSDFQSQQQIDAARKAAEVQDQINQGALQTAQDNADKQAVIDKQAADTKYAADKAAFDKQLDLLEKQLNATKDAGRRKKILEQIQTLFDNSGLNAGDQAHAAGKLIAIALADGLKSEVKAVEDGAKTLVEAINKYIKVKSPAAAGPWHDDPPESMGRRVVDLVAAGMKKRAAAAFAGLQLPTLEPGFGLGSPTSIGAAAATAGTAGLAPVTHVTNIDLGPTFERIFGGQRLIRYVDQGLSELPTG